MIRRALLIGCLLMSIQQLSGINTVMYYSATIIEMSGITADKSTAVWLASLPAFINFLFSLNGMFLVERLGRRDLTLGSLFGVVIALIFIGVGFQFGDYQESSFIILIGLIFYLFCFAPGMGPMPWTINSEIYPLWARSFCYSTSTSINWFFNFLVSFTFLTMVHTFSTQFTLFLYAGIALMGWVLLYLFLPETRGKSLEEIETLFENPMQQVCKGEDNFEYEYVGRTSSRQTVPSKAKVLLLFQP